MPNNVVRSMVLICDMYVLLEFLYCPIRTVPIFSYIHTSSYSYARNHNIYIYIYIFIYLFIYMYIYIIIIYVLKNISGQ